VQTAQRPVPAEATAWLNDKVNNSSSSLIMPPSVAGSAGRPQQGQVSTKAVRPERSRAFIGGGWGEEGGGH
jgi:hypothetical protein